MKWVELLRALQWPLGQLDDDAFGTVDVAESVAVPVLLHFANEFGAVRAQLLTSPPPPGALYGVCGDA